MKLIDTSRTLQEWVLPKGDEHTTFQAYVGETHSIVIFFRRERGSPIRVPFFVENCGGIQDAEFCIWYHGVPNECINEYILSISDSETQQKGGTP